MLVFVCRDVQKWNSNPYPDLRKKLAAKSLKFFADPLISVPRLAPVLTFARLRVLVY